MGVQCFYYTRVVSCCGFEQGAAAVFLLSWPYRSLKDSAYKLVCITYPMWGAIESLLQKTHFGRSPLGGFPPCAVLDCFQHSCHSMEVPSTLGCALCNFTMDQFSCWESSLVIRTSSMISIHAMLVILQRGCAPWILSSGSNTYLSLGSSRNLLVTFDYLQLHPRSANLIPVAGFCFDTLNAHHRGTCARRQDEAI